MHRFSLLVVAALFACQTSYSSKFQNEEGGFPEPSTLLKNAHGENKQLASIGRLQAAMSCTASLWKPAGVDARSAALVITNGHCVMPYSDRATTYEVWLNRATSPGWNFTLNYFVDTPQAQKTFTVKSVVYASMKTVDLALVELNVSWAELEQDGFQALPQARSSALPGTDIRTIGIPEAGFSAEEQFLRESHCVEETRVSIVEWYWAWLDTHRNSCADIREGSSGSPVLNAQGEVFALINTTSAGGISDSCYLSNPCEMQRPGAFMVANKNYAINIVGLSSCFVDRALRFGPDCPLPPPATVAYSGAPFTPTRPVDREGQPILWNIQANKPLWKLGAVGDVDCRDKDDYRNEKLPTTEIPAENGVYLLCLQKPDGDERFPSIVVLSVDTRPPTLKPELSLLATERGVMFEPIFQVPELSGYVVGYGPVASTRCETLTLTPYRRIPILIERRNLPAKVCVQGEDHAGNRGPVFAYEVTIQDASILRSNMRTKPTGQKSKKHDVIRKE